MPLGWWQDLGRGCPLSREVANTPAVETNRTCEVATALAPKAGASLVLSETVAEDDQQARRPRLLLCRQLAIHFRPPGGVAWRRGW